jgi:hypothetical protein
MAFFQRDVFPESFNSETMGSGTVRIRMVLDCDEKTIDLLVPNWRLTPGIQSVIVTPEGERALAKP